MATATTTTRTIPPPPRRCHMEGTGDGHPRSPPLSMPLSAVVAAAAVTVAEVMTSVVEGGREWDQQPPSGAWLGSGYFGWSVGALAMAAVATAAVGAGTAVAATAAVSGAEACLPYLYRLICAPIANSLPRWSSARLNGTSPTPYIVNTAHRQRRASPTPHISNTTHQQHLPSLTPPIANDLDRWNSSRLNVTSPATHIVDDAHRLNTAHRQYRTSPPASSVGTPLT